MEIDHKTLIQILYIFLNILTVTKMATALGFEVISDKYTEMDN